MKIQFLGQNCFLFTYKNQVILSDPFYSIQENLSGFKLENQIIDYILITHAHGDHIADVEKVLEAYPEAVVIGQPEICAYFKSKNQIDINLGGSAKLEDLKLTMLPAQHTSSFPDGSYGGVPCGYMFRYEGKNLYFAGDTGVMADMAIFPKQFGDITAAILPIGSHYTMCANKASFAASELLNTPLVIGCHFDTFDAIKINHDSAQASFKEKGVELILPKLGESVEL